MPGSNPQLNLAAVWAFMEARGIDSVSEMARLTGIDRTYLSRVLRGQRPAQPSQVLVIAQALMVPPIAILGPAEEAA